MTKSNFDQFLEQGFIHDVFMAQIHYFIYRTIGENHDSLSALESQMDTKMITHIQNSSHDLSILLLHRIFEKRSKRNSHHTCINNVLGKCEMQVSDHFPITFRDWLPDEYNYPEIQNLSQISGVPIPLKGFRNASFFIQFLREVLAVEKIQGAIVSIGKVRDSAIAHNEYIAKNPPIDSFWNHYDLLQRVGRLYLIIISKIFANTHYTTDYEVKPNTVDNQVMYECNWLFDFLVEKIGRDNIVCWWLEKNHSSDDE